MVEKHNGKLYVICGPIGSGKSTWARKQAEENGCIVANDDAIVTAIHGGSYGLYNKKYKPLYKGVEQNIISHAICLGLDVVVDRTNYSRKMRARYFSLARSLDCIPVLVLFEWPEPIVSAKARFNSDPRGLSFEVWLEAANRHYKYYQEPDSSLEDFKDENVIRIVR